MFDDHAHRISEAQRHLPGGFAIQIIIERNFFPLKNVGGHHPPRRRAGFPVERRLLVRVLAVAKVFHLPKADGGFVGEFFFNPPAGLEVGGDHRVVMRGVRERLDRQLVAELVRDPEGTLHLFQHRAVISGIAQHQNILVVLRCRPQKRHAADVDVLDQLVVIQRFSLEHFLKRIEIDRDQIKGGDAVGFHGIGVLGFVGKPQQPAENFGVEGFHAAVQDFRETGQRRHLGDIHLRLAERGGGAARGDDLGLEIDQPVGQINHPGFIGDGQKSAANLSHARTASWNIGTRFFRRGRLRYLINHGEKSAFGEHLDSQRLGFG